MNAVIPLFLDIEKPNPNRSFVDRHIVEISFIISTFVQFIFGPFTLMLGIGAGITYSTHTLSKLQLKNTPKSIDITQAVFAILGAFASIVRVSPAAAVGGFIFKIIPYLTSFSIGTTLYDSYKNCH